MTKHEKPKIIKANFLLQQRIGAGPMNSGIIARCQKIIDNNDVDFSPLAKKYLDELAAAIKKLKSGDLKKDDAIEEMTQSVMQLKANAAPFKYTLVSNLANVMLGFLEAVKNLDKDAIEIITAHHRTLSTIITKKMKGDGGKVGKQMEAELKAACERYFAKT